MNLQIFISLTNDQDTMYVCHNEVRLSLQSLARHATRNTTERPRFDFLMASTHHMASGDLHCVNLCVTRRAAV